MNKCALIVLGMHRTGSSLLATCLSRLGGGYLGKEMPSDSWNPRGYGESLDVYNLNERILKQRNLSWYSFGESEFRPGQREKEIEEIVATIALHGDFGGAEFGVIKDPRLSRLLDVWDAALRSVPVSTAHAITLRSPVESALSLWTRDRLHPRFGLALWLRTYLDIASSFASNSVIFDHSEVAKGYDHWSEKLTEVLSGIGVSRSSGECRGVVEQCFEPTLYRSRDIDLPESDHAIRDLAMSVYGEMKFHGLGALVDRRCEIDNQLKGLQDSFLIWDDAYRRYINLLYGARSSVKSFAKLLDEDH